MDPNNPSLTDPETLTQAEVERLLAQVAGEGPDEPIITRSGESEPSRKTSVEPYDFRHPVFLSANELRRLRVEHEEIIQRIAALMSVYLRTEFGMRLAKLQTIPYSTFTSSISAPAHLVLFKVEPLRGVCVLDINVRLSLTMVDRLMGGTGNSAPQMRELSEIEAALLDQGIHIIIGEWCNHWQRLQEVRPVMLGHESNGQFLQTAHADTIMLALTIDARLGEIQEQIQLAFPFATLEPLIRQLNTKMRAEASLDEATASPQPRWNPDLSSVKIPVTAEWPTLEMTARQLAALKTGDVLSIKPEFIDAVRIRLAGVPKFSGRLGTQGGKWAVEISQRIKE